MTNDRTVTAGLCAMLAALAGLAGCGRAPAESGADPAPAGVAQGNLSPATFLRIKAQVLKKGDRQTYCNMYNNNPHLALKNMEIFLHPDTGQANINCDLKLSDFNHMVIRTKESAYYVIKLLKNDKPPTLVVSQKLRSSPAIEAEVDKLFGEAIAEIEKGR